MSDSHIDNRSPAAALPVISADDAEYIRRHCPVTFKKLQDLVRDGKIVIVQREQE
jgi:hypothetical protein